MIFLSICKFYSPSYNKLSLQINKILFHFRNPLSPKFSMPLGKSRLTQTGIKSIKTTAQYQVMNPPMMMICQKYQPSRPFHNWHLPNRSLRNLPLMVKKYLTQMLLHKICINCPWSILSKSGSLRPNSTKMIKSTTPHLFWKATKNSRKSFRILQAGTF